MLAKEKYAFRGREVAEHEADFIPFTAQTRMSGVNLEGRRFARARRNRSASWCRNRAELSRRE